MKGKGYNENRVQLWLPGTLISPHSECRCVTLHQVAGGLWLVRGSICPAVIGCQPRVTLCPLISDSGVWSLFCLIIMILTPAQTSLWQVRPGRDKAHYSGIITHHNSNMVTHHITSHPLVFEFEDPLNTALNATDVISLKRNSLATADDTLTHVCWECLLWILRVNSQVWTAATNGGQDPHFCKQNICTK